MLAGGLNRRLTGVYNVANSFAISQNSTKSVSSYKIGNSLILVNML